MVGRFRRFSLRLRRFLSQGSIEQGIAPETLREERLRAYSTSKILETSDLDCVLKSDLMNKEKYRRLAWKETGNTEDRCNALTTEWLKEWQVQTRVEKIAQCKGMQDSIGFSHFMPVTGFRNSVSGISHSLSCTPDSKVRIPHSKINKFPDSLTRGQKEKLCYHGLM